MSFPLLETRPPFAYQYLAEKASKLHLLGMSACAIARALVDSVFSPNVVKVFVV